MWEALHKASGYSASLLAFATMYTGVTLGYSPYAQYEEWVAVLLGLLFALSITWWLWSMYHQRYATRKPNAPPLRVFTPHTGPIEGVP